MGTSTTTQLLKKLRSCVYVCTGGIGLFSVYNIYQENEKFYDSFILPAVHSLNPEMAHNLGVLTSKYKLLPKTKYVDCETLRTKWVHPINERSVFGEYHHLMEDLNVDDEKFKTYFRLNREQFNEVLGLISNEIKKEDTNYRKSITPEERLAICLRLRSMPWRIVPWNPLPFTVLAGFESYHSSGLSKSGFARLYCSWNYEVSKVVREIEDSPLALFAVVEKLVATEVWGLKFKNPIGMAAGFDKQGEAVEGLHDIGFGFVEVGSVTPRPQPGNDKPRVFRLVDNQAIINRYGFNSEGHEEVYKRLQNLKRSKSFDGVLGVNLGKNKDSSDPIDDYVRGIEQFGDVADYLVINISSPNTPGLRDWQRKEQLEELLHRVVAARDSLRGTHKPPLLVKLAPDLTAQERRDIAQVLSKPECAVDGLIISNTTVGRTPELAGPHVHESGGLSGAPLAAVSTQLIAEMYTATKGRIPIIGVGGVFTGEDAYNKIRAGASLIQLYTAFIYHGPPRVTRIKKELDSLLQKDGFKSISEAVGKGVK